MGARDVAVIDRVLRVRTSRSRGYAWPGSEVVDPLPNAPLASKLDRSKKRTSQCQCAQRKFKMRKQLLEPTSERCSSPWRGARTKSAESANVTAGNEGCRPGAGDRVANYGGPFRICLAGAANEQEMRRPFFGENRGGLKSEWGRGDRVDGLFTSRSGGNGTGKNRAEDVRVWD